MMALVLHDPIEQILVWSENSALANQSVVVKRNCFVAKNFRCEGAASRAWNSNPTYQSTQNHELSTRTTAHFRKDFKELNNSLPFLNVVMCSGNKSKFNFQSRRHVKTRHAWIPLLLFCEIAECLGTSLLKLKRSVSRIDEMLDFQSEFLQPTFDCGTLATELLSLILPNYLAP